MAYDYALVHVKYTIPLAILLTVVPWPLYNRLHFLQVAVLVFIAFVATLPWDAYLIRHNVWNYPPEAIIGPRLYGVPYEELFFFVVQTYITALLYVLCNKAVLHATCLDRIDKPPTYMRRAAWAGQAFFIALAAYGAHLVHLGKEGTYLGLILIWAPPFALLIWTVAGRFILRLPWFATVIPILLPTVYLWMVDELALGRGTWAIESGTKLGICLFGVLEIEEATFFLATNTLIVLGMATFDKYLAVIDAFPHLFPTMPRYPTPLMLVQSRIADTGTYDMPRIRGIVEAVGRLKKKSRSFYLASGAFTGRLRIDLVLLYSFCRMADDLVDSARSAREVTEWIAKLSGFLDLLYKERKRMSDPVVAKYITDEFPAFARTALFLLPATILPSKPLYLLLDGFRMDALFGADQTSFPIADDDQLRHYGSCVAGTVGELCVALIAHHCDPDMPAERLHTLRTAAADMGIALQYVNIARDIAVDARIGRVYLPTTWLEEAGLKHSTVMDKPGDARVEKLRGRLLAKAFALYVDARPVMRQLPAGAKGPMVAAVECYMEIGRVLRGGARPKTEHGRATVPLARRLRTAYKALWQL